MAAASLLGVWLNIHRDAAGPSPSPSAGPRRRCRRGDAGWRWSHVHRHRHVACFWIWGVTNAAWAYADVTHGLAPQATVQSVYFAMSIYGIARWRNRPSGKHSDKCGPSGAGSLPEN
jgi:hypothetical protein